MLVKYGLLGCTVFLYTISAMLSHHYLVDLYYWLAVRLFRRWLVSYHCSPAVSLLVMQLPIELSFALRFPSTVSLNLSFGLPVSREPLRSLEYRICLGCYSFSILRTCSDHLRFLCIRMSDILFLWLFLAL